MEKTLVCYCYYEQNDICIENLLFFIKNGIINDSKYFFIMIVNGEKLLENFDESMISYLNLCSIITLSKSSMCIPIKSGTI